MSSRWVNVLVGLFALVLPAGGAWGDELVKTDGTTLSGKVVVEQKDSVTFETHASGMTLRQKIARSQIRSIQREVREGPGYCPLPIVGVIGQDVLARDIEAGVREARRSNPQYVVLVIDSPGGAIDEMAKIIDVVAANPDLKFLAYVQKRALSAAAIIAMSCPQIYVAPQASIGAAVPFKIGPDGTPVAVEAKFESAIQAEMRNAARIGGHDELWVRGMTELDVALALDTSGEDQTPAIRIASDAPKDARRIKGAGKILTLTAPDAVEFGLCAGTAGDVAALKSNLNIKAWHVSDDGTAWRLMEDRARSARAAIDRQIERVKYVDRAVPTLAYVDRRLRQLTARATFIRDAVDDMKKQYHAEMRELESQRQLALRRASIGASPTAAVAQINEDFQAQRKAVAQRYLPQLHAYGQELKAGAGEVDQLVEKRKQLLASAPSAEE